MHLLDGMWLVSANSERRERVRINASFENASKNNDTLDASNVNDETRHNNPDEVSELSAPETHFDRQAHTHHNYQLHVLMFSGNQVFHAGNVANKLSIGKPCTHKKFLENLTEYNHRIISERNMVVNFRQLSQ